MRGGEGRVGEGHYGSCQDHSTAHTLMPPLMTAPHTVYHHAPVPLNLSSKWADESTNQFSSHARSNHAPPWNTLSHCRCVVSFPPG